MIGEEDISDDVSVGDRGQKGQMNAVGGDEQEHWVEEVE